MALNTTNLEEAVRKIIASSPYDNSQYQYVHIARIGKALKNNFYPLVTAATRLVSFKGPEEATANLTVAIIVPYDKEYTCIDEDEAEAIFGKTNHEIANFIIANQIQQHINALHEIAMWIIGKKKLPNNGAGIYKRPFLDYQLKGEAYINIYFGREDPQGNDDFRNRATIYEALLAQEELIAVELNLPVTGTWSDCCSIFSPEPYTPCELGEEPLNYLVDKDEIIP